MRVARAVHFPLHPVTCVSRKPTVLEFDILDDYEHHASHCPRCRRARHHRAFVSSDLCSEGTSLSTDICEYLYGGGDGHVYSTNLSYARYFRVEMPLHFMQARRLLGNAMMQGRSRQHKSPRSILSKGAKKITGQDIPPYVLVVRSRRRR